MKLFELLTRIPVLTMIFNIVLYTAIPQSRLASTKLTYNIVYLSIMSLQSVVYYFAFHKEVLNMERSWNKMELLRLKMGKNGLQTKACIISELRVGDLVFLRGDTISPADIMVVDTSNQRHSEKIFHVSEKRITGDNKIMTKSAIRNLNPISNIKSSKSFTNLAAKQSCPDSAEKIIKKFSGNVEYDPPNSFVNFGGSFRLKNDPIVSRINSENMLFCGTKLYTSWIIGMVIYNGFYTKIMQRNYKQSLLGKDLLKFKKTVVYRFMDKVAVLCFISSLCFSFIFMIMMIFNSNHFEVLMVIHQASFSSLFFIQLGHQLSYAFELIPATMYIVYDLSCFLVCLQLQESVPKTLNIIKAKINGYIKAIMIRCKKKIPRSDRRGSMRKSTGMNTTKAARSKRGVLVRGAHRRVTLQSNIDQTSQGAIEYGGSPNASSKELDGVTPKHKGSSSSKTKIGRTVIGQLSDIGNSPNNHDYLKIIDFSIIPDLGAIDHVVLDKTDTLTTSQLEIVKFATLSRCYHLDCSKIPEKIIEIKTPGNNLAINDSQDEIIKESADYSEKSQEYLNEIIGDYKSEVCDEDSTWTEMLRNMDQPSYNLEVGGNGSNHHCGTFGFGGGGHSEESPTHRPTLNVSMVDDDRIKAPSTRGANLKDDLLSVSGNGSIAKKSFINLAPRLGGFNLTSMKSRTFIQKDGEDSSRGLHLPDLSQEKSDGVISDESDTFKMTLKPNKELPLNKFIRDVYFKREDIEQFFAMATLFNRFTLEGERTSKAQAIEDKAISDLIKHLGYVLSESKKNKDKDGSMGTEFRIKSTTTNHTVDYQIVGVNYFSHDRERASIVFMDMGAGGNEAFLLVKGIDRSMTSALNMNDKDKNVYRELSANYKAAGLKQLVYGIRKMEAEEVFSYRSTYVEILKSPRDQKEGFELLAQDLEKNLKFMGCFGIRDTICPEGLEFSYLLRSIGIKFSILSGDNKDNCLNVARTLELTKSGMEESELTFNIYNTTEVEIMNSMKRIIDQIYEDIKKLNQDEMKIATADIETDVDGKKVDMDMEMIKLKLFKSAGDNENDYNDDQQEILNYEIDPLSFRNLTKRTLLLNGECVNIIINSEFLLCQFRSILLFCSSIVGYSMQPSHKATIVKLLRSQNNVVLAVGDGFNDIRMIREANIGVQLMNSDVPVVFSDMVVGSIGILSKVMFSKAVNFHQNLTQSVLMISWINFTQVGLYFIFYYLGSLYSDIYLPLLKIERLIMAVLISFICIWDSLYSEGLMSQMPIFYREQTLVKTYFVLLLLAELMASLVEVTFVVIFFIFYLNELMDSTGKPVGIRYFENFIIIVSSVNACFKIWLLRWGNSIGINIVIGAIAIGVVPAAYAFSFTSMSDTSTDFWFLVSDSTSLLSLLICIAIPCCCAYLINLILKTLYKSFLMIHQYKLDRLTKNIPERRNTKRLNTSELRAFFQEQLKDVLLRNTVGRFQVTTLISLVRKFNSALKTKASTSIIKIISVDLFNFQVGLERYTNRIIERVDRRKFRLYLMRFMRKFSAFQIIVYLMVYSGAMAVGLSSANFRAVGMLDTTIPYLIVFLIVLLYVNRSPVFNNRQYGWLVAIGVFSACLTLILSIISHNRFELNMVDLYNLRLWFTVSFEMIDSFMFAGTHLIIRLLW